MNFLREKISYYKLLTTFNATALFGVISWLFLNAKTAEKAFVNFAISGFIFAIIIFGIFIYKMRYYLKKMEKYNE
jgi:hypothetical protein